jgi:hypothetical protein
MLHPPHYSRRPKLAFLGGRHHLGEKRVEQAAAEVRGGAVSFASGRSQSLGNDAQLLREGVRLY